MSMTQFLFFMIITLNRLDRLMLSFFYFFRLHKMSFAKPFSIDSVIDTQSLKIQEKCSINQGKITYKSLAVKDISCTSKQLTRSKLKKSVKPRTTTMQSNKLFSDRSRRGYVIPCNSYRRFFKANKTSHNHQSTNVQISGQVSVCNCNKSSRSNLSCYAPRNRLQMGATWFGPITVILVCFTLFCLAAFPIVSVNSLPSKSHHNNAINNYEPNNINDDLVDNNIHMRQERNPDHRTLAWKLNLYKAQSDISRK